MKEHPGKKDEAEGFIRGFRAVIVLVCAGLLGYFLYTTTVHPDSKYPFKLGLDLAGGSHLVYEADVSSLRPEEVPDLMNVLREVIERRINVFGVSEPIVQVEKSSFVAETKKERLIVELPGVANVDDAVKEIGKTPLLEFKLVDQNIIKEQQAAAAANTDGFENSVEPGKAEVKTDGVEKKDPYIPTGLSGRYLQRAELVFGQGNRSGLSNEPIVSITFNDEGAKLFAKITGENVAVKQELIRSKMRLVDQTAFNVNRCSLSFVNPFYSYNLLIFS